MCEVITSFRVCCAIFSAGLVYMYCILIKLLIYVYKALSKSFMVSNTESLTHQHHSYQEFQQQQNNYNKNSKQCLVPQLQSEKPYL